MLWNVNVGTIDIGQVVGGQGVHHTIWVKFEASRFLTNAMQNLLVMDWQLSL